MKAGLEKAVQHKDKLLEYDRNRYKTPTHHTIWGELMHSKLQLWPGQVPLCPSSPIVDTLWVLGFTNSELALNQMVLQQNLARLIQIVDHVECLC